MPSTPHLERHFTPTEAVRDVVIGMAVHWHAAVRGGAPMLLTGGAAGAAFAIARAFG